MTIRQKLGMILDVKLLQKLTLKTVVFIAGKKIQLP